MDARSSQCLPRIITPAERIEESCRSPSEYNILYHNNGDGKFTT